MALACLTERKSVFDISRRYHLMGGKLVLKAETMLGDFRRAGGKHRWINDGTDGKKATLEVSKDGHAQSYSFTIEQAVAAGYTKNVLWAKRPDQMLRSRCITDLIRMVAPEIAGGDYSEDEVADFDDDRSKSSASRVTLETTATKVEPTTRKRSSSKVAATTTQPSTDATVPSADTAEASTDSTVVDAEFTASDSAATTENAAAFETLDTTNSAENHAAQVKQMDIVHFMHLAIGKLGWQVDEILKMVNGKHNTSHASFSEFTDEQQTKIMNNFVNVGRKNNIEIEVPADFVPF